MALQMNKRYRPETDHVDPTKDLPTDRQIKLKTNMLHIVKVGPHGFWEIHYDKGITPARLQGQWAGIEDAKAAVRAYLQVMGRMTEAEGQI